jgi:hypothetical protein
MNWKATILGMSLIAMACSTSKENEMWKEAAVLHHMSYLISKEIEIDLAELKRMNLLQDSVQAIAADFETWRSNQVEVPGYELSEHTHDHSSHAAVELTAQQMLELQKALQSQLESIRTRIKNLKNIR